MAHVMIDNTVWARTFQQAFTAAQREARTTPGVTDVLVTRTNEEDDRRTRRGGWETVYKWTVEYIRGEEKDEHGTV